MVIKLKNFVFKQPFVIENINLIRTTFTIVSFGMVPKITRTALSLLKCINIGGNAIVKVLSDDPNIICYSKSH